MEPLVSELLRLFVLFCVFQTHLATIRFVLLQVGLPYSFDLAAFLGHYG